MKYDMGNTQIKLLLMKKHSKNQLNQHVQDLVLLNFRKTYNFSIHEKDSLIGEIWGYCCNFLYNIGSREGSATILKLAWNWTRGIQKRETKLPTKQNTVPKGFSPHTNNSM